MRLYDEYIKICKSIKSIDTRENIQQKAKRNELKRLLLPFDRELVETEIIYNRIYYDKIDSRWI